MSIRRILLSCTFLASANPGGLAAPATESEVTVLERAAWANPALAGLRLRVAPGTGGGLLVDARAPDGELASTARAWLGRQRGVERLQVEVDPRLRAPASSEEAAPEILARAEAALRRDAGARAHADRLQGAVLTREGLLRMEASTEWTAGTERRVARLLRVQPGIRAVAWTGARAPRPAPTPGAREEAPRRTRLELDPIQPEATAAPPGEAAGSSRTRLHVEPLPAGPAAAEAAGTGEATVLEKLRPGAPPATPAATAPVRTGSADAREAAEAAGGKGATRPAGTASQPEPPPARAPSPSEAVRPAEPAPLSPAVAVPRPRLPAKPAPPVAPGPSSPREGDGRAPIDLVLEDFLGRAIALEGAPSTVKARVEQGVATYSGRVDTRERAAVLRELTRNFDGIIRVTGSLALAGTGEAIPMDAVPD